MDAKLSPPSVRHGARGRVRPWTRVVFGLLLLAGTLIQACSDNNGSTGPTFACRENASGQSRTGSGSARLAERMPGEPGAGHRRRHRRLGIVVQVTVSPEHRSIAVVVRPSP